MEQYLGPINEYIIINGSPSIPVIKYGLLRDLRLKAVLGENAKFEQPVVFALRYIFVTRLAGTRALYKLDGVEASSEIDYDCAADCECKQ